MSIKASKQSITALFESLNKQIIPQSTEINNMAEQFCTTEFNSIGSNHIGLKKIENLTENALEKWNAKK